MKITFIYFMPIEVYGGGERWFLNSLAAMSAAGHDCVAFASTHDPCGGISKRVYKKIGFPSAENKSSDYDLIFEKVTFAEVAATAAGGDFTWLQQYMSVEDSIHLLAALPPMQPVALTTLGHEPFDFFAYYRKRRNDLFMEVSSFSAAAVSARGLPAKSLYGAEWRRNLKCGSDPGQKRGFVVLGRILEHKRIDLAVRALDGWTLTVVGRESDPKCLAGLRKDARGKRVRFVHDADDSAKTRMLSEAKALVACSSFYKRDGARRPMSPELLGLVLLEAVVAGTLPIASDIPPFREVLCALGLGEFLFIDNDPADLRAKMRRVDGLSPVEYDRRLAAAQSAASNHFLWDTLPDRVLSSYENFVRH